MARQNADGSFPKDSKKSVYGEMFENPVTGLIGTWDWAQCDTTLLCQAIAAVNRRGDLISFCTDAHNTAGALTIISGGDKRRMWFNTYDEADALLNRLANLP